MTEPHSAAGATAPSARESAEARRLVRIGLAITLLIALFGLLARGQMIAWGLVFPGPVNVFFRLYALHEPALLLLLVAWTVVAAVVMARRAPVANGGTRLERLRAPSVRAVGLVAALMFVVALATWYHVHHAVLLTMDEFTSDFQARILAHGELRATLPREWQPYVDAMAPVFTAYRDLDGGWLSQYLPGYALLKTPFVLTGLEVLLNPLLAALSVLLLAAIARRLWPDEGLRPWMALAFFVTSSEVLMTSGTGYSMPAHLALNLLWLWLYQRGDARSWGVALAVGVLALGLHNPMPHALFVAPFLLRLVRERRWGRAAAAVVAYGIGGLIWIGWLRMANPFARPGGPGLFSMFALPNALAFWLQTVNLSLLFTWHAPLFGALAIAGVARARRLGPVMTDVALGVAFTLAFYLFFPLTQGHGWGYRYAYQVLGSLALLAAAGTPSLVSAVGARRAQSLLIASFATALLVQVPLRFWQGERFIRPYAAAYRHLSSRPARVVLVNADSIWYGRDLIRNDPYLRGQPVVLAARLLTREGRAAIEAAYPGQVLEVRDGELLRLGLTPWIRGRR
ncbi:MAG: hypothetical protein ACJ79A_12775 [Gemmatimonadaceae bacterium]